ncbi:MAG: hypothetical protein ACYYK0_07650 [Candidatus Eutrophobiaceae bacterium]
MSISLADFARMLPTTVFPEQSLEVSDDGRKYLLHWGAGRIIIQLAPETALRLGALSLERQRVSIEFDGLDAEQRLEWLSCFQRKFQRGGG